MLIGLCGVPGAGKTTVARYLRFVNGFDHINVGDPIKGMMRGFYRTLDVSSEDIDRRLDGDLKEVPDGLLNGKSPREAMQHLGKGWRDLISPTLFADRWGDRLEASENAVADGMRYAEEVPVLKRLGGVLVRVERPGFEVDPNSHIAERQDLPVDFVLENSGSVIDLEHATEDLLDKIAAKQAA
jgi:hypothetical protein